MSWLIWIVAAINGAAAFAIAASDKGWPDAFWDDKRAWLITSLVVVMVTPLAQGVLSELGEKARRKAVERSKKLEVALASSLVYLADNAGAPWKSTGVQVFLVRRYWFTKRHIGIAKVRLSSIESSGVCWTKGKGLIGRCWESQQPEFLNAAEYFKPYNGFNESTWMSMSPHTRYGLTFADFKRLKGKYGTIAAAPIVSEHGKYIGCVTADIPEGNSHSSIRQEPVLESLVFTARTVRELLK